MFTFRYKPLCMYDDEIDQEYNKRISEFRRDLYEINRKYDEKVKERRRQLYNQISECRHDSQCKDDSIQNRFEQLSNYVNTVFADTSSQQTQHPSGNMNYYSKTSFTTLDEDGKLHKKVTENNNGHQTSYEETTEMVNDQQKRKHVRWLM